MRKPLAVCCTHSNAAPYLEYDCPHQPRLIVIFYQESWRVSTIYAHNYEHEPRLILSFCKYSLWNVHIHGREETGLVPISRTHHMRWGKMLNRETAPPTSVNPERAMGRSTVFVALITDRMLISSVMGDRVPRPFPPWLASSGIGTEQRERAEKK